MSMAKKNWEFGDELRKAAGQIATGADSKLAAILAEEPVPLTVFVQDAKYLGNPPLSAIQHDAVRHLERIYYAGTYPMLAEEFETGKKQGRLHIASSDAVWREEKYWSEPLRMINFACLQWGKGSTSVDTPIYNSRTGQWVRLGDWGREDLVATADHQVGKVFAAKGSKSFKEGVGQMFRVKTRKGREVDVWEGHRFLSWGKRYYSTGKRVIGFASQKSQVAWTRLWDLNVGDPIAITTIVPEPSECLSGIPDRDVELVGLWLGNGSMTRGGGNTFTCGEQSPVTRARAAELFEMIPGTWAKQFLDESGGSKRWRVQPKQAGSDRLTSEAAAELAYHYDLAGKGSYQKAIPSEFYSLDNRQSALLLSRLIDTDGWVSFSNTPEIGYSTVSKQFAEDVLRLMLRLGAAAELKEKHTHFEGKPCLSYQVRVRDRRGLQSLAEKLTLLDKESKRLELLQFLVERAGSKQHTAHGDLVWDKIVSIEPLGEGEYWTLSVDDTAAYISANGTYDHNSGKDHTIRIALLRISYLLLCLRSPQVYYGMPEQDTIHLLNVASTAPQAQQAFFTPIVRAVKRPSGWFNDKVTPRQNTITFAKNIEAVSGHSDAESQEGLNLLLGIADEIDAFKSKKEMTRRGSSSREPTKSAEGILDMMKSSGSTRFPEVFKNVRISYPRYLGSTIQRLTEEARADFLERGQKSRHYVSGPMATWEVNPRVKGREAFADDYREDAVQARAKYECKPSRAINPYFRNVQAVDAAFEWVDHEPIRVSYALDLNVGSDRRVWSPRYTFSPDFYPIRGAIYTMHADLAIAGDRAGIAMAHVADYVEHEAIATDDDGATHAVREVRPKVKADFVISYSADISMDPPREIQIRWARQLAMELIRRGFNIRLISFDSFQSADSMQILEAKGIETKKISTDLSEEPWRNLRDLMYEGRLSIPRLRVLDVRKEQFLLREELLSLSRMPNGHIDHPANGCFVGETRVPLLDGTIPEIKSLVGKGDVWVYSARPDGSIVPGRARARETKKTQHLVDVVLDSGYSARCTPDHKWMLRDGTYKEARNLVPGVDRLMPMNRVWPVNGGYERLTDGFGHRKLTHVLVAEHFAGRKVVEGEIVHHKNHVKTDNSPDNVGIMDRVEHLKHHSAERWANDTGFVARVRAGHAAWRVTDAAKEALANRDFQKRWVELDTYEKRHAVMAKKLPFYRHDVTVESLRAVLDEETANGAARRIGCGRNVVVSRLKLAGYKSWAEFKAAADSNHKVRYVLPVELDEPVSVYDLEVDEWHNFALNGGVFVHNSKDLGDALAGAVMTAVQIGGREEESRERRFYEPSGFQTGGAAELPFGVRSLNKIWVTGMPSAF